MEKSSSNIRGSDIPSSGWPSARSPLPSTPSLSEFSPHLSSIHSVSSPWSQTTSRTTNSSSQFPPLSSVPRKSSTDNPNTGVNLRQFNNADWASVFSAPLDPSLFATLAASGVLGQLPPFSEGSSPSSSFHPLHSSSSLSSPTISLSPRQDISGSWVQPTYSYKLPLLTSKTSLPRSNTSLVSHPRMPKDKLPFCQFSFQSLWIHL